MSSGPPRRVRLGAAVLSGLLLASAFPPLDLGPLALVALAPLLWAWRDSGPRAGALYLAILAARRAPFCRITDTVGSSVTRSAGVAATASRTSPSSTSGRSPGARPRRVRRPGRHSARKAFSTRWAVIQRRGGSCATTTTWPLVTSQPRGLRKKPLPLSR